MANSNPIFSPVFVSFYFTVLLLFKAFTKLSLFYSVYAILKSLHVIMLIHFSVWFLKTFLFTSVEFCNVFPV